MEKLNILLLKSKKRPSTQTKFNVNMKPPQNEKTLSTLADSTKNLLGNRVVFQKIEAVPTEEPLLSDVELIQDAIQMRLQSQIGCLN